MQKSRKERKKLLGSQWHKVFNDFLDHQSLEPNQEKIGSEEFSDLSFDLVPVSEHKKEDLTQKLTEGS